MNSLRLEPKDVALSIDRENELRVREMSGHGIDTRELLENSLGRPQNARESRLFNVNWRVQEILLGLTVLLGWRLLMIDRSWWADSVPQVAKFFLTAGFPALWMIFFPILVARQRGVKKLFSDFSTSRVAKEFLLTMPVALLLMAGLAAGSSLLVHYGGRPLGTPQENAARGDIIALLLLSVTLTPLAEELFFRGFLYNYFRRKSPIYVAVITQATIFAIMHAYSPIRMFAVFCLGLTFGLVYQWRKTLIAPIIVHTAINGLAAVATILVLLVQLSTPYLGVRGNPTVDGYVVEELSEGGPAADAGLLPNDRIVAINGQQPDPERGIAALLAESKPGDSITVDVLRDDRPVRIEVTLERRPTK